MRAIIQKHPRKATAAGVLVAAATLTAGFEGYYGKTYRDIVGVPTVCFGETDKAAVEEGRSRTFTRAECLDMLRKRLPEYDEGFKACVMRDDIPNSVHIAGISFTYNVGVAGACRSSFVRYINVGEYAAACDALLFWDMAGRKHVKGLHNRRVAERKVCLEGLK